MADESLNYTGPSMTPTLVVGDGLKVLPYSGRPVRPGDVVVFQHPVQKYNIVHRAVRVDAQGIRTRGDNNSMDDPWQLQPEQILGRVVSIVRGDEARPLAGGRHGQAVAVWAWIRKWVRSVITKLLQPMYRRVANSGMIQRWLGRWIRPSIARFERPGGVEMHLFLGRRQIGRLRPEAGEWHIRAPFRLVVDVRTLPQSPPAAADETASARVESQQRENSPAGRIAPCAHEPTSLLQSKSGRRLPHSKTLPRC
jgi:hypothetical protein